MTTTAAIIAIVFSDLVTCILAHFRFHKGGLLLGNVLVNCVLPPVLLTVPLLKVFVSFNVRSSLFKLAVSRVTVALPFKM